MNHADWDDDIDVEDIKTLTLTRNELLYIDDSMTMLIEPETNLPLPFRPLAPKALIPAPANMIDKIGMAILATVDSPEAEVQLYVSELYILRELCVSYITINGERIGYNLKQKVYKALLGKEIEEGEMLSEERQRFENLLGKVEMNPKLDE